jgi:L-amino acid N-acyltransferase YncA
LELSIELSGDLQGKGIGVALLHEGLARVPAGQPVFAAVSPGNVRSLKAFLAVGFGPIGSEVIIQAGG